MLTGERRDALRERGWFLARDTTGDRVAELVQAAAAAVGGWCGVDPRTVDATFELGLPQYRADTRARDNQSLHFDYGHPLVAREPTNVYLAVGIHRAPEEVGREHGDGARTRLVRLGAIAGAREWPQLRTSTARVRAYGESHGSWLGWDGGRSYVERTVARLIDAIDGTGELVSYRALPREDWLEVSFGGNDFANRADEIAFFARHGLPLPELEETVVVRPGETLVIDNTSVCHARRGVRAGGEIRQIVCGRRRAPARLAARFGRELVARVTGRARPAGWMNRLLGRTSRAAPGRVGAESSLREPPGLLRMRNGSIFRPPVGRAVFAAARTLLGNGPRPRRSGACH